MYIYLSLLFCVYSGVEAERDVKYRHLPRYTYRILQKNGELSVLSYCVRDTAWSWFNLFYLSEMWTR